MAKNVVDMRLGVRSVEGLVSLIWRLFATKKEDVYFAVRTMAGVMKYSFHQSGICRYAFTVEYGTPPTLDDRAMYRWKRAALAELGGGRLSRVLLLAFPTDFLSNPRAAEQTNNKVTWMDAAPAGGATYLSISFTAEPRPAVEEAYRTNGIRILNHTALASGIHLLIDYYHADWQNADLSMPGDGKVADMLFSSQDPDKTGRPVRLVFGSTPKNGDALHIRELGGFAVKKPKI